MVIIYTIVVLKIQVKTISISTSHYHEVEFLNLYGEEHLPKFIKSVVLQVLNPVEM